MCVCPLSCAQLFVIPWTAGCQASLSMGFSRKECWSGLPCPPSGQSSHPLPHTYPFLRKAKPPGFSFQKKRDTLVSTSKAIHRL